MNDETKYVWLKLALVVFGVIVLGVYPMGLVWSAGWVWHGGQGLYYLQIIAAIYVVLGVFLIRASRNPVEHQSLILFTIWSSLVHAVVMGAQALGNSHELGHLLGDVPALLLVAAVLGYFNAGNYNQKAA